MSLKARMIDAVVQNAVWILVAAIFHLLVGWIYIRRSRMGLEKDIPIPAIGGDLDLALEGGKAVLKIKGAKTITASGTEFEGDFIIRQDAKPLLDKLVALVPAGWVHDALAAGEKAALAAAGAADAPAAAAPVAGA